MYVAARFSIVASILEEHRHVEGMRLLELAVGLSKSFAPRPRLLLFLGCVCARVTRSYAYVPIVILVGQGTHFG